VVNAALCQLFSGFGAHRHSDTRAELLNLGSKTRKVDLHGFKKKTVKHTTTRTKLKRNFLATVVHLGKPLR
jgi:hypothetical protein